MIGCGKDSVSQFVPMPEDIRGYQACHFAHVVSRPRSPEPALSRLHIQKMPSGGAVDITAAWRPPATRSGSEGAPENCRKNYFLSFLSSI